MTKEKSVIENNSFTESRNLAAEMIRDTAEKDNEYFNIYIDTPIKCNPKDVICETKGIKVAPNLFIPYILLSKLEANGKIKK